MNDYSKIQREAEALVGIDDIRLAPDVVLDLIAENERSTTREILQLAEIEALRKDRTDWQAECLKRGFEYVRESDDHYVLADLPEMADLLGMLLGVEVRTKDNDAYEEANSRMNEQVEGLINTIHAQEALRQDAERYRWLRDRNLNTIQQGGVFIGDTPRNVVLNGSDADEAVDAAILFEQRPLPSGCWEWVVPKGTEAPCRTCSGFGTIQTGIDEAPSTVCNACDGTGKGRDHDQP